MFVYGITSAAKLHNGLDDITFQQAQSTSNFNSSFLIDIVVPVQSAREVIENRSFQKSLKQASEALEGPAKDQQRRIELGKDAAVGTSISCLLYTSPSPRDLSTSRMPSSA